MNKLFSFSRSKLWLLGWLLLASLAKGQGSEEYGSGLKLNLNENGSKYVRFIIWNQIWARASEMNPGSMVNGQPVSWHYDLGIRRARMLAYAQINPRFLILTHYGINNQTFNTGGVPGGGITGNGGDFTAGKKPGIFFHDVWNEYAIIPSVNLRTQEANATTLFVGTGLHYWHGVSRMTSASTLNFMAIDAPIFNWFTIELADQFARYFGMYAKGKIANKVDYRFHVSKPFLTNTPLPRAADQSPLVGRAVDNNTGSNAWITAGYVMYQFWDAESNVLPFTVGTYLGTKRVLNIGAGFQRMPNATKHWAYRETTGDTIAVSNDAHILGLDVFLDTPLGPDKAALTLYSVLYDHQWGPNYYRTVGIMNQAVRDPGYSGMVNINGFGNARPLLGTGQIWYTQVGYLLPRRFLRKQQDMASPNNDEKIVNHYPNTLRKEDRLQLFGAYTLYNLEFVGGPVHAFDVGANYYISGHHAKVTLQYSARPHMPMGAERPQQGFRGEFILQTQIFL